MYISSQPTMAIKPLLSLLLLLLCGVACGRLITHGGGPADLLSDGVSPPLLPRLIPFRATTDSTCDQTYGFLPCTTTVLGNLFLILVYGYLMFLAASYLSSGSELLLEILGPGLIGGLLLPVLGALPDAMLILVSGLSGTTETAQSQVSVGMGLLAGSTVLILTLLWGTCVIVGKCDIQDSIAVDGKDTKGLSLTGSGVSTDIWTCYAARIMAVSVIPFIVVQLPQAMSSTSGRHLAVLIALILSLAMLLSYCLYQVFQPWIQTRRIAFAKHKHVISGILRHLRQHALGRLLRDDGTPNEDVIAKLFRALDVDGDGHISYAELKAMIIGIQFDEIYLDEAEATEKVMKDFDTSRDTKIDFQEFIAGISRWLDESRHSVASSNGGSNTVKHLEDFHKQTKREHYLLGDQSDEVVEGVENPKKITIKAVLLLLLGTLIAAAFADPLVDAVDNFSDATSIPTFFISFIGLPLATSSEAVSAIIFVSRKKQRSSSLTFSELYGAVTMNNVLCLSVFLALVYVRGLTWDFSAEVLVIVIVCVVMGAFASFRTTFPLWTSFVAFLLYPFSVALVYVLDYVLGWS
ncbi:sodium/calcium exchanger NCL-like [Rhododendron vialii]|uniref:sodium/calcium exchanger NCL-like n=1 Tax=Rhododendron vialii TaxID=182163 RepID=UPI00265FF77A|nr:sodium/calcium exchanger NCL-like [Rhododendron vialii]